MSSDNILQKFNFSGFYNLLTTEDVLKMLKERSNDKIVDFINKEFYNAFIQANMDMVKFLFETGKVDLYRIDNNFHTYMTLAIINKNIEIIKFLLEKGFKPNFETPNDGFTAILTAGRCGKLDLIKLLADNGADVCHKNHNGSNALHRYVRHFDENKCENYKNIINFLLEKGININDREHEDKLDSNGEVITMPNGGDTPLLIAMKGKFYDVAEYLIEKGANVNDTDEHGWSALGYAVKDQNYELIELILNLIKSINGGNITDIGKNIGTNINTCLDFAPTPKIKRMLEDGRDNFNMALLNYNSRRFNDGSKNININLSQIKPITYETTGGSSTITTGLSSTTTGLNSTAVSSNSQTTSCGTGSNGSNGSNSVILSGLHATAEGVYSHSINSGLNDPCEGCCGGISKSAEKIQYNPSKFISYITEKIQNNPNIQFSDLGSFTTNIPIPHQMELFETIKSAYQS